MNDLNAWGLDQATGSIQLKPGSAFCLPQDARATIGSADSTNNPTLITAVSLAIAS